MSLSPEQIEDRLEGMTATDIAAVLRIHPYRTPLDVYLEKIGDVTPFRGNESTKWGEILEPMIREDYELRHGVSVEEHGTLRHPEHAWWMATPDGLVFPRGSRVATNGLEIKVHDRDAVWFGGLEYGEPGTDEVPPHELVQCAWGIGASRLDRWDLVAFLGGRPVDYIILRDDDLIGTMKEEAERFLVDHVRARVPPPPDGGKAWDAWQKRRWKKNARDLVEIGSDPEVMGLVARLRKARADEADVQALKLKLTQEIKNVIADRGGLTFRDAETNKIANVTWRRNKDGVRKDVHQTVEQIRNRAGLFVSASADIAATAADAMRDLEDDKIAGVPAKEIAKFIDDAFGCLREIATFATVTKPAPGARPFVVPTWWKSKRAEDDDKTDNKTTDNTEEN